MLKHCSSYFGSTITCHSNSKDDLKDACPTKTLLEDICNSNKGSQRPQDKWTRPNACVCTRQLEAYSSFIVCISRLSENGTLETVGRYFQKQQEIIPSYVIHINTYAGLVRLKGISAAHKGITQVKVNRRWSLSSFVYIYEK